MYDLQITHCEVYKDNMLNVEIEKFNSQPRPVGILTEENNCFFLGTGFPLLYFSLCNAPNVFSGLQALTFLLQSHAVGI